MCLESIKNENYHYLLLVLPLLLLTVYEMHHFKSDIDVLYGNRKGGRGLLQIEVICKAEISDTKYKGDQFLNIVKSHKRSHPNMNSMIETAARVVEELSQSNENSHRKQEGIQHTKARLGESWLKKWENKIMLSQSIRNIVKKTRSCGCWGET
jgi:hypothetical protein